MPRSCSWRSRSVAGCSSGTGAPAVLSSVRETMTKRASPRKDQSGSDGSRLDSSMRTSIEERPTHVTCAHAAVHACRHALRVVRASESRNVHEPASSRRC